jgi:hypothetical protein
MSKQLVFTTAAGASSVITTDTTLNEALSTLEIRVYDYVDKGDSVTFTLSKDYANSLAAKIASELVIAIPTAKTTIDSKLLLNINTYNLINSNNVYSGAIFNNLTLSVKLDALTFEIKDADTIVETGTIALSQDHSYWKLSNGKGQLKLINNILVYKSVLTVVDKSYIDALSVANQTYTTKTIADLQTTLDKTALDSAKNAETRANTYTDQKTTKVTTELNTNITKSSSILTIKIEGNTKDISSLKTQIDDINAKAFSREAFIAYYNEFAKNMYPSQLAQTVYLKDSILKFRFDNAHSVRIEYINHTEITDKQSTEIAIGQHDSKHNGAFWVHQGYNDPSKNTYSLFAMKNHVVDKEALIEINESDGSIHLPSASYKSISAGVADGDVLGITADSTDTPAQQQVQVVLDPNSLNVGINVADGNDGTIQSYFFEQQQFNVVGKKIVNAAPPVASSDVATKAYVDMQIDKLRQDLGLH